MPLSRDQDLSILLLAAINLLPVLGVFAFGWNPTDLIWFYLLQCVITFVWGYAIVLALPRTLRDEHAISNGYNSGLTTVSFLLVAVVLIGFKHHLDSPDGAAFWSAGNLVTLLISFARAGFPPSAPGSTAARHRSMPSGGEPRRWSCPSSRRRSPLAPRS